MCHDDGLLTGQQPAFNFQPPRQSAPPVFMFPSAPPRQSAPPTSLFPSAPPRQSAPLASMFPSAPPRQSATPASLFPSAPPRQSAPPSGFQFQSVATLPAGAWFAPGNDGGSGTSTDQTRPAFSTSSIHPNLTPMIGPNAGRMGMGDFPGFSSTSEYYRTLGGVTGLWGFGQQPAAVPTTSSFNFGAAAAVAPTVGREFGGREPTRFGTRAEPGFREGYPNLFGTTAQPAQQTGLSSFGRAQTAAPTGGFSCGLGGFGCQQPVAVSTASPSSFFGTPTAAVAPTVWGGFGGFATPAQPAQQTRLSFGQTPTVAVGTAPTGSTFSFGVAAPATTTSAFSFGAPATTTSAFSFGAPATTTSAFSFGAPATTTTTTVAAAPTTFLFDVPTGVTGTARPVATARLFSSGLTPSAPTITYRNTGSIPLYASSSQRVTKTSGTGTAAAGSPFRAPDTRRPASVPTTSSSFTFRQVSNGNVNAVFEEGGSPGFFRGSDTARSGVDPNSQQTSTPTMTFSGTEGSTLYNPDGTVMFQSPGHGESTSFGAGWVFNITINVNMQPESGTHETSGTAPTVGGEDGNNVTTEGGIGGTALEPSRNQQ